MSRHAAAQQRSAYLTVTSYAMDEPPGRRPRWAPVRTRCRVYGTRGCIARRGRTGCPGIPRLLGIRGGRDAGLPGSLSALRVGDQSAPGAPARLTSAPVKTMPFGSTNDDIPRSCGAGGSAESAASNSRRRSRCWRSCCSVLTTLRLFVFPDLNAPVPSDAIVVLGGQTSQTSAEGIQLAREGFAPTLALSVPPSTRCPTGSSEIPRVHLLCFVAEPQTTQGEARIHREVRR